MLKKIPLSRPDISSLERQYVQQVLASGRLALGPFLEDFEQHIARLCGVKHAVAVNGGTAALHLIFRSLGLGEGDEVITTPYSFIASSNVILYEGARLRFVDVEPDTFNLDMNQVAAAISPATRAILAVDVFGLPADWPTLTTLAKTHNLHLIDDACEALDAHIGGRPLGSWGDATAFGFYPNKQVTTGEGGCITTNSSQLAALCRSLRNQGREDDATMEHVRLGYNYRMPELSAALGCAQLERLPHTQAERARVVDAYRTALAPLQQDIALPVEPAHVQRSWFVYVIRLHDHFPPEARETLIDFMEAQGVSASPYFPMGIHLQPYYRKRFGFKPGDFPVCEAVAARTIGLPLYPQLSDEEVAYIAQTLKKGLALLHKKFSPLVYVQG